MLATSEGTLALLSVEDDSPGVLGEHLPGAPTPLWPQVRMQFYNSLAETEFGTETISKNESAWKKGKRALRSLLPSDTDASAIRSNSDVCFVVGGGTSYFESNHERNWLVGDFADSNSKNSTILRWQSFGSVKQAFTNTWSLYPLETRAALHAKLRPLHDEQQASVRRLIAEFARLIPLPIGTQQVEGIITATLNQEGIRAHSDRAILRVIDRVQPRVVLMQSASFGSWSSLTHELKRRGIHVAEPQHGWIGPSHGAYNFGKAMHEDELRSTLPDTLLTFGSFWAEGLHHPAEIVEVGKPHLATYVDRALPLEERPRTVIVASSIAGVGETCDFVLALRNALPPSWVVKFRPHPSERATHESRYNRLVGVAGINFDLEPDTYRSLSDARAVVGVASTVLFEAAALDCAVFVRDSPYLDYYVGTIFGPAYSGVEGARALAASVNLSGAERNPVLVPQNDLWAPRPVEAYQNWLRGVLGQPELDR